MSEQPGLTLEQWKTAMVLTDVVRERTRQDQKWGVQNHPDVPTDQRESLELQCIAAKQRCCRAAKDGTLTWLDILVEELSEAAASGSPAEMRAELVQVAAVAVAWIEAIDRRAKVAS